MQKPITDISKDDQILFEEIKNYFLKNNFKNLENNSNHEDNLIFIVGMPRSGTIIGRTDNICTLILVYTAQESCPFLRREYKRTFADQ
jgi:hypothetical protein